MHELSLAGEILRVVESNLVGENYARVQCLTLQIGELAGVESDSLLFALTHMPCGNLLESTSIRFEPVPGSGYCPDCEKRVAIDFIHSPCILCGHHPLEHLDGTSIWIREIELV